MMKKFFSTFIVLMTGIIIKLLTKAKKKNDSCIVKDNINKRNSNGKFLANNILE